MKIVVRDKLGELVLVSGEACLEELQSEFQLGRWVGREFLSFLQQSQKICRTRGVAGLGEIVHVVPLGEDGLKKAEKDLEAAKKEHDKEIPKEILTSFPVPDVKNIAWIPVQSVQEAGAAPGRKDAVAQKASEDLKKAIEADGPALPFSVQYDHVKVSPSSTRELNPRRLT